MSSLNLTTDFTTHIRWMASMSTWRKSTPDGVQDTTWTRAVFDLANIRTGWGAFEAGMAPEWVMDPSLDRRAPRPKDGEWKRGFRVNIFCTALDGVREFATTGTGAGRGIVDLYNAYQAEVGAHPGKLPVVEFIGSKPARIGKGNTCIPIFKIVDWVARPEGLPAANEAARQTAPEVAPPSTPVPPPADNLASTEF